MGYGLRTEHSKKEHDGDRISTLGVMKTIGALHMKLSLYLLPTILCAACATSGTRMQVECEAVHSDFPEIFQCTYEAVAQRNPKILEDARAKLYLLRGEQLALAVLERRMTSLDAKVEWQRLYVELRAAKEQELYQSINALSQSLQASRNSQQQVPAAVTPQVHRSVNCISTKLGASVYTTCY